MVATGPRARASSIAQPTHGDTRCQRAHATQRRVAGRATSRSKPIGPPHRSQAPNSWLSSSASLRWSAAASRMAWPCSALTCARSKAIVGPSGSCSSSVLDISAPATMSSNCRASDNACCSVRLNSATSAERIARRSRTVSRRIRGIHHAYTRRRDSPVAVSAGRIQREFGVIRVVYRAESFFVQRSRDMATARSELMGVPILNRVIDVRASSSGVCAPTRGGSCRSARRCVWRTTRGNHHA